MVLPATRYAIAGTITVAYCLSLCLCLSVTSRCSIKRIERINPVFGIDCILKKFRYLENKGNSLWNIFLNSELRKFRHGIRSDETCCQLT